MDSEGWEVSRLEQHSGPSRSTFTSVLSLLECAEVQGTPSPVLQKPVFESTEPFRLWVVKGMAVYVMRQERTLKTSPRNLQSGPNCPESSLVGSGTGLPVFMGADIWPERL